MQSILSRLLVTATLATLVIKASEGFVSEDSIDCRVTGDICPINEICEFVCPDTCISTDLKVYGTSVYSIDSPICKSALHDLRISKWKDSETSVRIKTFKKDDCFLESSVRFGFASYRVRSNSCDVFKFVSPRISEEILDIASIHSTYLYSKYEAHTQHCFTTSTSASQTVEFGVYSHQEKYFGSANELFGKYGALVQNTYTWFNRGKMTDFGFQCIPTDTSLSIITSVAFRKDAYFQPSNITVIANKNENVTLTMRETSRDEMPWHLKTRWRKDYLNFTGSGVVQRTKLILINVSEASSGIYSLGYDGNSRRHDLSEKFGFVQLIVRSCPRGKYGLNCASECRPCLNGGICHDITGECVCAPGFHGSECEKACEPGYLGKMCSIKCPTTGNSMPERNLCKGLLICLPKPYGCSCASGYTGLDCSRECRRGSYGAGCKQEHYARYRHPKLDSCSKFNDSCDCSPGWHGVNCTERYPVLRNAPTLLNSSRTSIAVTFNEWSNSSDLGSGSPANYEVVYKKTGERLWISARNISAGARNRKTHEVNIMHLKPDTEYIIGVVVVDVTGNKQDMDIKVLREYTSCDLPSHPPLVTKRSVKNQMIQVKWELPAKYDWNCWDVNTVFKRRLQNSNETIMVRTYYEHYSFYSDPYITWIIEVCASPAVGKNNGTTCASPISITSDGPAFSSPVELKIIKKVTSVSLRWERPKTYGIELERYIINYTDIDTGNTGFIVVLSQDAVCDDENENYHCRTLNKLVSGHSYECEITAVSRNDDKTVIRRFTVKLETATNPDPLIPIFGVFIPLVFIVAFAIFILYMKEQRKNWASTLKVKFLPRKARNEFATSNAALDQMDIIETESLCDDFSNRISIADLPQYVKENVKNSNIKMEFMNIPNRHPLYPCIIARLGENKPKNRYGNILPYDHSRVVLDTINEDPFSNYIHANYINGYEKGKKYIAAQGPLLGTVNDFWRMVWNEGSCKIYMATNFVESGKPKCEKYWSDGISTYGAITVSLENSESYADFVIRTFKISKGEVSRELKQFHYTTWPDHGTPSNPSPFINFLKKASSYLPDFDAAIIVHCSAGIGRTGATILLDSMINMARTEKHVDLASHLCLMRKQRMNIVENLDQYIFVHHALVETLCFQDVCIKLSNFKKEFEKLQATDDVTGMTFIEKQYEALKNLSSDLRFQDMREAYLQENQSKNRSMMILPPDEARPFFSRNSTESVYINAVYVDSYSTKNAFVATQYPLPATVTDFWNMIYASKSKTVVLLQEMNFSEECTPQLWTSENLQTFGNFQVECHSVTEENHFRLVSLTLSVMNSETIKDPLSVNFIILKSWPLNENLPTESTVILSAISKVKALQCELDNHVITTICLDGVMACGIFCAILYICDQIEREKEVSVFQAVRCIKPHRPQFIIDAEQYRFLYNLVQMYLESS